VKVVVSGGSGFIGSHIVDSLVAESHDVVVIDREAPQFPNRGARYIQEDVRDPSVWHDALVGADAVSHQAARVGLGVRFSDVADYVSDNDLGTAAMLLAMDRVGFSGRIVLASSMVVYGEGGYTCKSCGSVRSLARSPEQLSAGRFDPSCPHCGGDLEPALTLEDAPIDPRNVYAATKIHQEHLCFAYGRETDASVIALRYHNVYGPRSPVNTPYAGVASIFLSSLSQGDAPRVFEDGGQRRDFVHVHDVARANLLALKAPASVQGSFNIASGTPHTILDLATELARAVGQSSPKPIVTGDWRLGDVRHIQASPASSLDQRTWCSTRRAGVLTPAWCCVKSFRRVPSCRTRHRTAREKPSSANDPGSLGHMTGEDPRTSWHRVGVSHLLNLLARHRAMHRRGSRTASPLVCVTTVLLMDLELADVVDRARRRAMEAGELADPAPGGFSSRLSPKARQVVADWLGDGGCQNGRRIDCR
jgi:dTDP-L-rhamnose 4-epimerase